MYICDPRYVSCLVFNYLKDHRFENTLHIFQRECPWLEMCEPFERPKDSLYEILMNYDHLLKMKFDQDKLLNTIELIYILSRDLKSHFQNSKIGKNFTSNKQSQPKLTHQFHTNSQDKSLPDLSSPQKWIKWPVLIEKLLGDQKFQFSLADTINKFLVVQKDKKVSHISIPPPPNMPTNNTKKVMNTFRLHPPLPSTSETQNGLSIIKLSNLPTQGSVYSKASCSIPTNDGLDPMDHSFSLDKERLTEILDTMEIDPDFEPLFNLINSKDYLTEDILNLTNEIIGDGDWVDIEDDEDNHEDECMPEDGLSTNNLPQQSEETIVDSIGTVTILNNQQMISLPESSNGIRQLEVTNEQTTSLLQKQECLTTAHNHPAKISNILPFKKQRHFYISCPPLTSLQQQQQQTEPVSSFFTETADAFEVARSHSEYNKNNETDHAAISRSDDKSNIQLVRTETPISKLQSSELISQQLDSRLKLYRKIAPKPIVETVMMTPTSTMNLSTPSYNNHFSTPISDRGIDLKKSRKEVDALQILSGNFYDNNQISSSPSLHLQKDDNQAISTKLKKPKRKSADMPELSFVTPIASLSETDIDVFLNQVHAPPLD